jgi:hypothetical protein
MAVHLAKATPAEPLEANAVIRFRKYGGTYSFAAIKGSVDSSLWFVQGHPPLTWDELLYWPLTWDELLYWIGPHNWHQIEVMS